MVLFSFLFVVLLAAVLKFLRDFDRDTRGKPLTGHRTASTQSLR